MASDHLDEQQPIDERKPSRDPHTPAPPPPREGPPLVNEGPELPRSVHC